ncbi:MAG TPA: bacterial transcriptional activator domain-containing protein [Pyrinomonadaceae bacterium]|nr:bacterial transcriptional activator domain-containing protein [Pyrinomonadaceae bacterium]
MPTLRLQLFGRFCVSHNGRELYNFDAAKVQELLCYLALFRKPHAREMLAGTFWGESSTTRAKKYLRQTLWQLQAALEANLGPLKRRVVLVEADWVQLNPALAAHLDVVEFETACALGNESRELDPETAQTLQRAVQLYRADLLEGCYQDWCLYERERLQSIYLATLDRLIRYCEITENYQQGLAYAAEVLRYDPARERAHRQMMRLYDVAGDRTAALRQYQRCVVALKAELGVPPSARTIKLRELIDADELEPTIPFLLKTEPNPENSASLLPEVLEHLKQVRSTLSNIQRQVQKDIRTVEVALTGRR